MKKTLTLITVIFTMVLSIHAQDVNIPDAVFKAALVGNPSINTNGDGEIQVSEAAAFTDTMYVGGRGITDLTGIEAFTQINGLDCGGNLLTSLNVSANTELKYLSCYGNPLTSLDLSTNTALSFLYCNGNPLTSLDLSTNTALSNLICPSNRLTSLDLSANTSLSILNCSYNPLTSLDLSTNTSLISLFCNNNALTSLNLGNVYLYNGFDARNNNLTCISVGDVGFMNAYYGYAIDVNAHYSLDCDCELVPTITTSPSVTTNLCPGTPVTLSSSPATSYQWSNGRTRNSIVVYKDGSYTVTIPSPNCSLSATLTSLPTVVSYQPCGTPPVSGVSNITDTTATVNFGTVTCGQSYEIRYKVRSGGTWTTISGITNSPYTLTGLAPNTRYTVQVRTKCSDRPVSYSLWSTSQIFLTAANLFAGGETIGSLSAHAGFGISITPNPAVNNAVLRITGNKGNVSVSISDMSDKQLWQSLNISSSQLSLPVQNFAAGVYMVTVSDGENKQVLKLVKQ